MNRNSRVTKKSTTQRNVSFTRSLGENAPDLIANLVVSGTIPAIEELVANAYDADATRVDIDYFPDRDFLMISDNGTGMNDEGVGSFYRLGDSPKLEDPVSSNGRVKIGKFGVATILLKSLAHQYKLNTWRDGVRTIVKETLEGKVTSDKEIGGRESVLRDEDSHGTQIALTGLKFSEDDGHFSLERLKKRVQWDLPSLPDFEIYINSNKVEAKSIQHSTNFRVDTQGKQMGRLEGNIYLANSASPMSGVHIYVNGRSIGDPKSLLGQYVTKGGIRDRIIGILHADDLEEAILFDRGRFREDHPGVVEMEWTVKKALGKVRNYAETSSKKSTVARVRGQRNTLLRKAGMKIASTGLAGISRDTKFAFDEDMGSEIPGRFDSVDNVFYVNGRSPAVAVDSSTTVPRYEQALLSSLVDSLALHLINYGRAEMDGRVSFPAFLKERAQIWDQIISSREDKSSQTPELHSMIVYQPSELARHSGRSIGSIRGMIDSAVLNSTSDGVTGEDFLDLENGLIGLVPLYDVVHKRHPPNALSITLDRFRNVLDLAGEGARPFVYNLSRLEDKPFYVVEGTCEERVYDLFKQEGADLRRKDSNPQDLFREFGDKFYSMPQIVENTQGLDLKEVARVVSSSKGNKPSIRNKNKGRGVVFHFGDFISALQHVRGNNGHTSR